MNMNRTLGGVVLLLTVLWAVPAHATRPFAVTEDAAALEPGGIRLEAGLSQDSGGTPVAWEDRYQFLVELSYSLYANLDVEFEVPYVVANDPAKSPAYGDGPGDVWTKFKVNFMKERAANPLTLSGQLGLRFPTGDDVTGRNKTDVRLAALASKTFAPVTAHGNLFYTFAGYDIGGASAKDVLGLSLGLEIGTPIPQTSVVSEVVWEQARFSGRDDTVDVMGGLVGRLSDDVRADLTGRFSLSGDSPDLTVAFGLTFDTGGF